MEAGSLNFPAGISFLTTVTRQPRDTHRQKPEILVRIFGFLRILPAGMTFLQNQPRAYSSCSPKSEFPDGAATTCPRSRLLSPPSISPEPNAKWRCWPADWSRLNATSTSLPSIVVVPTQTCCSQQGFHCIFSPNASALIPSHCSLSAAFCIPFAHKSCIHFCFPPTRP